MSEPVHHDPRAEARTAWTRAALGDDDAVPVRASMDAGFRSYWRVAGADGSCIVMDSPPDKEDVRPWLQVRGLLEAGGVRVPRVLAQDVDAGFLLLEDLGADTYLHVIDGDNADALFDEWFLGTHLGIELDARERDALCGVYHVLVDAALAQPQVLVHRDFMPRNLMPVQGGPVEGDGPAVLDFQDAVRGPIAYDAISLFKDAFLSWPEQRVATWLDRYHARAVAAGLPVPERERFRRDADLIGVQRHLKVVGIFARLHHRDGKPKYLADAPRFFAYFDAVLPKYPELAGLQRFIEHKVKPEMARRAAIVPA